MSSKPMNQSAPDKVTPTFQTQSHIYILEKLVTIPTIVVDKTTGEKLINFLSDS